jgi:hypothetical protein
MPFEIVMKVTLSIAGNRNVLARLRAGRRKPSRALMTHGRTKVLQGCAQEILASAHRGRGGGDHHAVA